MYPYLFTKNGERLPHSSMHARNLAMRQQALCCRPLLLYRKSTSKTYPYPPTEKRRKTSYSSMHNSSRNSATIIRKFRDQGSKFSNETQRVCLRPLLLFWKSFAL